MTEYSVAFVGTGDPDAADGAAMAYEHARGYARLDDCRLAACADLVKANAERFAGEWEIDDEHVYEDYERMLAEVEPDVVSVCTPPAAHADIVVGCAASGVVDAIHCEKPMALTWGESREMARECERHGVQLTFNHMRRFGDVFRDAKRRLDEGAIGDLQRIEYTWGDFYDLGTHAIDLCNYFNDECAAEWIIAQLDYREEDVRFDAHTENQMFASWQYENGVHGVASTGDGAAIAPGDWRLVGTEGTIDVHIEDEVKFRVRAADGTPETVRYDALAPGETCIDRAIADVVGSLRDGATSGLCARNALNATEIIFGGYESVRRRGRIDLPLRIDDNPLEEMVDSGTLSPAPQTGD